MVDKYIENGKVAVLVSPQYGAGWSSWSSGDVALSKLFDTDIVKALLYDGDVLEIADTKYPDDYNGGAEDLQIVWVDVGKRFRIHEYDGSETLVLLNDEDYYTA